MAVALTYAAGVPVVKVGRIAGQFAKPALGRHRADRRRGAAVLPRPHGQRRGLRGRGRAGPTPSAWWPPTSSRRRRSTCCGRSPRVGSPTCRRCTCGTSSSSRRPARASATSASPSEIDRALRFMAACGIDLGAEEGLHQVDFCTSHEALILPYEECLTRVDSLTGDWYDCSAHMVWVGDRTRQLDGAHLEFLAGINNPVGAKVGPDCTPAEVVALCERLNPDRLPGRLTLITRLGSGQGHRAAPGAGAGGRGRGPRRRLGLRPHAREHVHQRGRPQDRGASTTSSPSCARSSTSTVTRGPGPAGSMWSSPATTSPSASAAPRRSSRCDLDARYTTTCDPRLNARQSLDLAFRVAEFLRT